MINDIFYQILNLSINGSYIIICVILARFFLKKAPKSYSFALWFIVFFRLVCPYTLETEFSFFEKTEIEPIEVSMTFDTKESTKTEVIAPDFSEIYNQTLILPYTKSHTSIFAVIWCVGVLAFLVVSIISYTKLKKRLSTFLHLEKNIYIVDFLETPFVLGLIRPKIYIPSNLTEKEKSYIIAHEEHHIKRFDHISRFFAFCILVLHWFNPLVWVAFVLSGRDMELSIDEKVIKTQLNAETVKEYAILLLSVGIKNKKISPLFVTPTFGNGDIKERVSNIMNFKKISIVVGGLLTVVVIALAIIFTTSKLNLQYDTEFASFTVSSYIDYFYKSESTDEFKQAQQDGLLPNYPNLNESIYLIYALNIAHGLLPQSEYHSEFIEYKSLYLVYEYLELTETNSELATKLALLYLPNVSYDIKDSVITNTGYINSEILLYDKTSEEVPVTYGKVTTVVKPIDIFQGMDRTQFGLLWEELSLQYDDKTKLINAYLSIVLNTLIDNYSETVYKDEVTHDVSISFLSNPYN